MAVLCERLKELRSGRGYYQREVAKFLGISLRAYQYYEAGGREPNIENIKKLAAYFKVSTDYLLGFADTGSTPESAN